MYVGLNIGNDEIKTLTVKGRQVKKWHWLALPEGLVRDGLILQPQALGKKIGDLFRSEKIPRDRVVISLSGLSFTYRFLNLPRMKPVDLEEALMRAARKEISLPLEELYLSWQALPGKGDELAFFVLGVPRNMVDAMVQTLHEAGISPYLMDLHPLALARAANQGNAIVVNLETNYFDIVFIADGTPAVIHTVNPRSEGLTLEDNIRRLADEISKTAAFYQSSQPQHQPNPAIPLLLTGDLAAEPAAVELLQAQVDYPIQPLMPQIEFPPDFPVASYAANIGLALKKTPPKPGAGEGTYYHDININILSGKYRKHRARPLPFRSILIGAIPVIAVVCLFPLSQARAQLTADNTRLDSELLDVSRQLNLANIIADEASQKEEIIKEITASANTLKATNSSILSTRGDYTYDLERVTRNMPPNTIFTTVEIDNDVISIQGEADSVFAVVDYATALETRETFSEVRINSLVEGSSMSDSSEVETPPQESGIIIFDILITK